MQASGEARVGGTYRHVLQVEGCGEVVMVGTYTEIDPPNKLAYTQSCEATPGMPPMPESTVSVEFTERNGETEVCLVHSGLANQEMRDNVGSGWSGAFEKLSGVLEESSS